MLAMTVILSPLSADALAIIAWLLGVLAAAFACGLWFCFVMICRGRTWTSWMTHLVGLPLLMIEAWLYAMWFF